MLSAKRNKGREHDCHPLGWQPSRFLTDRAEAERAFALAEQLGSVNAAATQLGTTWPSLRNAFTRHGLGMPARNPEALRQRAIAAARQRPGQPATPTLDPVFARSTLAPCRPESGHRLSCMSGSAATRSTPSWARMWWSSSTARAALAGPPPGPGRSSAGPTAATGWPTNAPAGPTAATPTEPTAPAGPSNPGSARWRPIPAHLRRPASNVAESIRKELWRHTAIGSIRPRSFGCSARRCFVPGAFKGQAEARHLPEAASAV
jgi:hypothetical protein